MRQILALIVVVSLLVPSIAMAYPEKETKEKMEVYDSFGNKIIEKMISSKEESKIESDLSQGKISPAIANLLPKTRDFGILTYIVSYGRGKVYIPLHRDGSFLRFFLRPIFFQYEKGITFAKFGANYAWDRFKTFGDYGVMIRSQRGIMIGFVGLHIKIGHKLTPDTHIFIGGSLITVGNDLFL